MIKVLLLLACVNGSARPPRQAHETRPATDRWFAPDKVKHFFVSAFIQSATFSTVRVAKASRSNAQLIAGVTSTAFGIGKEIHDRRTSKQFSAKDLVWDGAGALTAAALLNGTR